MSISSEEFRLLYNRHAGALLRFVYRFTGNQQQAEEILHEVFSELLKSKPEATDADLKAWLFTVAKNKSLNFEKRKKREVLSPSAIEAAVDSESLEEKISESQIMHRLHQLQAKLPMDLAQTWELRKQGLDYHQIALNLNIPVGTVKSRFSRLVDFLRKELGLEN